MLRPGSQTARLLELLSDGEPHEIREIHEVSGVGRPNSRAADLRQLGYTVEYWFELDPRSRRRRHFYRLLSGPDRAGAARVSEAVLPVLGVDRASAVQAGGAGSSPATRSTVLHLGGLNHGQPIAGREVEPLGIAGSAVPEQLDLDELLAELNAIRSFWLAARHEQLARDSA